MTRDERKIQNLIDYGISLLLAKKLVAHDYNLTKIKEVSLKDTFRDLNTFTEEEIDEVFTKVKGQAKDKNEKLIENFINYGISSNHAKALMQRGYTVSSIQAGIPKKVFQQLGIFTDEEIDEIFEKVKRQPIAEEVMLRLITESEMHCCFCADLTKEPPVIIHHIEEYHKSQDNSYDNLVVLCLHHHGEVHTIRQISRPNFPPARILDMKQKWSQILKEYRKGKGNRCKPGTEGDIQKLAKQIAKQDMIEHYTAVLGGVPTRAIPDVIENVSKASSNALEGKDQRFQVKTSFNNNAIVHSIHAREDVKTQLRISPQFAKEFAEKYQKLIEHGEPLEIDGTGITLSGSKLLEDIASENQEGRFKIIPQYRKPAIQRMSLIELKSRRTYVLEDIKGNIVKGEKSFTFNGFACNNLLEIAYRLNFAEEKTDSFQFDMRIHFERWNSINLQALPYFDKFHKFFIHLMEGWELDTTLEIDGEDVLLGGGINLKEQDTIKRYWKWFQYIFLVRKVFEYIDEQVAFDESVFVFSEEDYDKLLTIYNVISQNNVQKVKTSVKTSLIAKEDLSNIQMLAQWKEPTSMLTTPGEQEQIKIFGKDVLLPKIYHALTKVTPKIHADVNAIIPGQEVLIEWIPAKDCEYVFGFTQEEK